MLLLKRIGFDTPDIVWLSSFQCRDKRTELFLELCTNGFLAGPRVTTANVDAYVR